jgi:hypothetical protein
MLGRYFNEFLIWAILHFSVTSLQNLGSKTELLSLNANWIWMVAVLKVAINFISYTRKQSFDEECEKVNEEKFLFRKKSRQV